MQDAFESLPCCLIGEDTVPQACPVELTRGVQHIVTEGINIAARSLPLKEGDEVILTTHEHVGGAAPWLALQEKRKLGRLSPNDSR